MSKIQYKFKRHAAEGEKIPPQLATILKTLEKLGTDFIARDELVKELEKPVGDDANALKARQPVERVVAFYQKRMVTDGFIEMNKPVAEPKAPKDPAAAKAPKGKAKVPAAETAPAEVAESMSI